MKGKGKGKEFSVKRDEEYEDEGFEEYEEDEEDTAIHTNPFSYVTRSATYRDVTDSFCKAQTQRTDDIRDFVRWIQKIFGDGGASVEEKEKQYVRFFRKEMTRNMDEDSSMRKLHIAKSFWKPQAVKGIMFPLSAKRIPADEIVACLEEEEERRGIWLLILEEVLHSAANSQRGPGSPKKQSSTEKLNGKRIKKSQTTRTLGGTRKKQSKRKVPVPHVRTQVLHPVHSDFVPSAPRTKPVLPSLNIDDMGENREAVGSYSAHELQRAAGSSNATSMRKTANTARTVGRKAVDAKKARPGGVRKKVELDVERDEQVILEYLARARQDVERVLRAITKTPDAKRIK